MSEQAYAVSGSAGRPRRHAWIGVAGLHGARVCCLLLLLTLAWGPHWPFSHFGIVAPPAGLLNTGFDLADLLLVGILAGWGLALLTGQDSLELRPRWISWPMLLLALAAVLASFPAQDRSAALHFAIRTIALAVLFLYLRSSLCRGRLTPATLACWLAPGLGLNGLLAIAQIIHQDPLGLTWLGEPGMLRSTPGTAVVLVHGKPFLRAFGVLPHPNVLGGLLAAGIPLVAGLLYNPATIGGIPVKRVAPSGHSAGLVRDCLLLLCLALMAAGLVLSFSRSAWLGFLLGWLYVACWRGGARWRLTRRVALFGAGIGLVVAMVLVIEWDAVSVRLRPESNQLERFSLQERLSLQELTLKVIAQRPLTGVGGNNLGRAEAQYLLPGGGGGSQPLPVHDTYLLAQAELGPLGTGAWLALMFVPVVGLALYRRNRHAAQAGGAAFTPEDSIAAGVAQRSTVWQALAGCSLTVVAVTGLFDFYIWVNEPVAVLWVVALALFASPATTLRV
jgi:O-antigen ligase